MDNGAVVILVVLALAAGMYIGYIMDQPEVVVPIPYQGVDCASRYIVINQNDTDRIVYEENQIIDLTNYTPLIGDFDGDGRDEIRLYNRSV